MALTNRVAEHRKARNETLRQTAAAVGMDASHLSKIENGTRTCPDPKKVALAQHFGTSIEALFFPELGASEAPNDTEKEPALV